MFPYDAKTMAIEVPTTASTTLLTGTNQIYQIAVGYGDINSGTSFQAGCGTDFVYMIGVATIVMPVNMRCNATDFVVKDNSGLTFEKYTIVYTPYLQTATATSTGGGNGGTTTVNVAGGYNGPNYHDWLLVSMMFLFLISFIVWPRLFKAITTLFRKGKKYNDDI